jgi:hypothetical protein
VPPRADWEKVVTPVVDFVAGRPEADTERIVRFGWSFGGYLAPRAACAEHRLAACVADPGQFDMFDMAVARMPKEMRAALRSGGPALDPFLDEMMEGDARRFFFTARMRAFGAATPRELVSMQREYSLKGRVEQIECPTLVCDTIAGGRPNSSTTRWSARRTTSYSRRRKEPTDIARAEHRCPSTPKRSTGSTGPWRRFNTDPSRRTYENPSFTTFRRRAAGYDPTVGTGPSSRR